MPGREYKVRIVEHHLPCAEKKSKELVEEYARLEIKWAVRAAYEIVRNRYEKESKG